MKRTYFLLSVLLRKTGKIFGFMLALFVLNSSLLITNCFSQWVQASNGLGDQVIHSMTVSGNTLYAGTRENGVYISTDNGSSWQQSSLTNQDIEALAADGSNLFAGTFGFPVSYGVFSSSNAGANWIQSPLNSQIVKSLLISGGSIFAGADFNGGLYGVFMSTNNGANWTQTSLNNKITYSLGAGVGRIFAGTSLSGVYYSTDNGTSWTQTSLNSGTIWSLASNGNRVYAGAFSGLFISSDNGSSWTPTTIVNQTVRSIAALNKDVIAGTDGFGVYVSNDSGSTWIQRNEGLGTLQVFATAVLNGYLFAGTIGHGVYKRPLQEIIGITQISSETPNAFSLSQNYPNPFNPATKIRFDIPPSKGDRGMTTKLAIYDMLGKEVITLVSENLKAGTYESYFDASNYASGVYYYKLTAGDFVETRKMILVK
jgi:hypothetical protein